MGDTLNLACFGKSQTTEEAFFFAITRKSAPSSMTLADTSSGTRMIMQTSGDLIYDDFLGPQPGYENFHIHAGTYAADSVSHLFKRYVNILFFKIPFYSI